MKSSITQDLRSSSTCSESSLHLASSLHQFRQIRDAILRLIRGSAFFHFPPKKPHFLPFVGAQSSCFSNLELINAKSLTNCFIDNQTGKQRLPMGNMENSCYRTGGSVSEQLHKNFGRKNYCTSRIADRHRSLESQLDVELYSLCGGRSFYLGHRQQFGRKSCSKFPWGGVDFSRLDQRVSVILIHQLFQNWSCL